MKANRKVRFSVGVGTGIDRKEEEFTLGELGYKSYRDRNLSKFLDEKWKEWKESVVRGGWRID